MRILFTHLDVNNHNHNAIYNNTFEDKEITVCEAVDTIVYKDKSINQKEKEALRVKAINFLNTFNQNELDEENLPPSITFRKDIKYMLTTNEDIHDGLYNGAIGTLKHIIFSKRTNKADKVSAEPIVKRVYLQFFESTRIGKENRITNSKLFKEDRIDPFEFGKDKPLSVIQFEERQLKFGKGKSPDYQLVRKQFALIPSEAITICKAEGQTYEKIAVSLKYTTKTDKEFDLGTNKLYVALSRVTKLSGLYMYGRDSILPDKFKCLNKYKRAEALKEEIQKHEQNSTNTEMKRLRSDDVRMINNFKFLEENGLRTDGFYLHRPNMKLRVLSTNISTYNHSKRLAMQSDWGFKNCDLILLCETHSHYGQFSKKHELKMITENYLSNYETIFCTGSLDFQASNGQMCFLKQQDMNTVIGSCHLMYTNAERRTGIIRHPDLTKMWEYNVYLYKFNEYNDEDSIKLMCLYRHPKCNKAQFLVELYAFLNNILWVNNRATPIVIMGDFNIDFNKDENQNILDRLQKDYSLVPLLKKAHTHGYVKKKESTDEYEVRYSQPDWCFTNCSTFNKWKLNAFLYETWFTDHSPIILEIEKLI